MESFGERLRCVGLFLTASPLLCVHRTCMSTGKPCLVELRREHAVRRSYGRIRMTSSAASSVQSLLWNPFSVLAVSESLQQTTRVRRRFCLGLTRSRRRTCARLRVSTRNPYREQCALRTASRGCGLWEGMKYEYKVEECGERKGVILVRT